MEGEEILDTHMTGLMGTQIKRAMVTAKIVLPGVHRACSTKRVSEIISLTMRRIVHTVPVHHTAVREMRTVKVANIKEQILAAATTRCRTDDHLSGRSSPSGAVLGAPVRNRDRVGMTTRIIIGHNSLRPPTPTGLHVNPGPRCG